jgi:hypothetical protein
MGLCIVISCIEIDDGYRPDTSQGQSGELTTQTGPAHTQQPDCRTPAPLAFDAP